jgi:cobalt-zinc-cadmium efflux system outer membrane protein
MRVRVVLAVGIVAAIGALSPARSADLHLEQALARARESSPIVRAGAAELAAARGRLSQARVPFTANPVLSGDLARHTGPGGEEQIDNGVQLEQEVEVGGQRGLKIAAAEHDVARAERALADRRRTVEGEVRRAFFGLAASERRRALAAERLAIATRVAEAARRRTHAGEAGSLDARLAELETTRADQERTAAETEQARAEARLATAIGAEPGETLSAVGADEALAPLASEPSLVERALAERPDLAAAREDRARFETEARLARRRGEVPNPVLRAFYRQELFEEHIAGGGVSIPIPVWNREQGSTVELLAQASGAATEVARLTAEIPRQVHLAVRRRAAAEEAWRLSEREALPAAAAAHDLLERGYDAGYLSLPDMLVQEDRLLQVRRAAIDAWLDLHEADADVIEATGAELP